MIDVVVAFKKAIASVAFRKATATIAFKKAIADISLGKFLIFRFFFENLGLSDSESKALNKSVLDASALSDTATTDLSKIKSDQTATTDSTVFDFGTAQNDSSQTSDAIDTFAIGKALQDSSSLSEVQTMNFHKFVEESTGVTDDLDGEATTDDDQEMTFVKVRSNLATMVDAFAHSTGRGLSDTIGSSDSGSLRGQGYCAFDYFEADYVGYSQSF
tara:strand:- start:690 stop:1337 length:648 start_codon:yes stop_codon:yes gene_type:complete